MHRTEQPLWSGLPGAELGPYVLVEEIGAGGMGVVFRARHRDSGNIVALKFVRDPRASNLAGLRREISLLRTLLHPGVIRVIDGGTYNGRPWVAMEFLEGRTLAVVLRSIHSDLGSQVSETTTLEPGTMPFSQTPPRAPLRRAHAISVPGARESLPQLLTLIRRVSETLAFLHGEGVVHRDLKPSNIFVRADGMPVLMDFGLMRRYWSGEREVVDAPTTFAGTSAFMAPEQARDERLDARADLYALGCILYAALTGMPPFVAASMEELRHLHATADPLPPSRVAHNIIPALDDLVIRLLAKRPADRIGYASEVSTILGGLGAEGWPSDGVPEPRLYLYMPELTGRDSTLTTLVNGMERLGTGSGGFVLIGGESGIGKTATLSHAVRLATARGARVVVGNCFPVGTGSPNGIQSSGPHGPLARMLQTIADMCLSGGPSVTAKLLGEHAKVLAPYDPSLAQVPGIDQLPDPPPTNGDAARKRLFVALASALHALAREKPLVLVLDDLHWADELTTEFLDWLPASFFEDNRLTIVASFRSEEITPSLAKLRSAQYVQSIDLSTLDEPAILAMVRGMLAVTEPPAILGTFLVAASAGNPFFVAEYVRAAVAENLLTRDVRGRWIVNDSSTGIEAWPLPRSLKALVTRRLASIAPESRALLWLTSAIGRQTQVRFLTTVGQALGLWTDDVPGAMQSLKELKSRQILEEHHDGTVSFVHDQLREVAYEITPADLRRRMHATIARCLEDANPAHISDSSYRVDGSGSNETSETAVVFSTLADHWARAEIHDRAFSCFRRAGNVARKVYSNSTAARCYEAARLEYQRAGVAAQPVDTEQHREVLEAHGDVLGTMGKHALARDAYSAAVAVAIRPLDRARVRRKFGKQWGAQHEHRNALSSYQEAERELWVETPRATGRVWWHEWIEISTERMWACYWLNELDEMNTLVEPIATAAKKYGGAVQRAHFNQCRTALNIRLERYRLSDATVGYARAALTAARRTKEASEIGPVRFGLAFCLLFSGRLAEASRSLKEGLLEADRLGDVPLTLRYLTYLTIAERRLLRVAEVQSHGQRLASLATAAATLDYLGSASSQLAWVALRQGDGVQSLRLVQAALEAWNKCPIVHPFQWTAHWPGLALAILHGDGDAAVSHARALSAPTQQRLPDAIEQVLARGIAAATGDVPSDGLTQFRLALEKARQEGFL